jgi:hypothetical protein
MSSGFSSAFFASSAITSTEYVPMHPGPAMGPHPVKPYLGPWVPPYKSPHPIIYVPQHDSFSWSLGPDTVAFGHALMESNLWRPDRIEGLAAYQVEPPEPLSKNWAAWFQGRPFNWTTLRAFWVAVRENPQVDSVGLGIANGSLVGAGVALMIRLFSSQVIGIPTIIGIVGASGIVGALAGFMYGTLDKGKVVNTPVAHLHLAAKSPLNLKG